MPDTLKKPIINQSKVEISAAHFVNEINKAAFSTLTHDEKAATFVYALVEICFNEMKNQTEKQIKEIKAKKTTDEKVKQTHIYLQKGIFMAGEIPKILCENLYEIWKERLKNDITKMKADILQGK